MRAIDVDERGDRVFGVFNLCDWWCTAVAVSVGCEGRVFSNLLTPKIC